MINRQDISILTVYAVTLVIVGILVVVLMNFNSWFLISSEAPQSGYTPAARNTVAEDDIKNDFLSQPKFKTLGPLLSEDEIKKIQAEENQDGEADGEPTPIVRREVRKSNPFLPFAVITKTQSPQN